MVPLLGHTIACIDRQVIRVDITPYVVVHLVRVELECLAREVGE